MNFSPPSEIRDLILYIWKILDNPQILKDDLQNFIAFDLRLLSLTKAKKLVDQAIKDQYLVEDESLEYVRLHDQLNDDFLNWQNNGNKKLKKINPILRSGWRDKLPISSMQKLSALLVDLIDPAILSEAEKLRASSVQLSSMEFKSEISGHAKENSGKNKGIEYPFSINIKTQEIYHNCPDFIQNRYQEKKFCKHLGRLIMKLNAKEPEQTITLLKSITTNHDIWKFKIN